MTNTNDSILGGGFYALTKKEVSLPPRCTTRRFSNSNESLTVKFKSDSWFEFAGSSARS